MFNYEICVNSAAIISSFTEHPNHCRFCSVTNERPTFKNHSHIIPEFLGRNNTSDPNECDSCNNKFSKYESSLYALFQPYLTFTQVKGKRKVPVFQGLNGRTGFRTVFKSGANVRNMNFGPNLDEFQYNYTKKEITINSRHSYIPIHAYKALVKIGFNLLPLEEMHQFQWLGDWLYSQDQIMFDGFGTIFQSNIVNKKFEHPMAILYRSTSTRKDKRVFPEYSLILCSGNVIIQAFLPPTIRMIDDQKSEDILTLTPIPFSLCRYKKLKPDKTYKFNFESYDLNSSTKTVLKRSSTFSYGELITNAL